MALGAVVWSEGSPVTNSVDDGFRPSQQVIDGVSRRDQVFNVEMGRPQRSAGLVGVLLRGPAVGIDDQVEVKVDGVDE